MSSDGDTSAKAAHLRQCALKVAPGTAVHMRLLTRLLKFGGPKTDPEEALHNLRFIMGEAAPGSKQEKTAAYNFRMHKGTDRVGVDMFDRTLSPRARRAHRRRLSAVLDFMSAGRRPGRQVRQPGNA